MAVVTATNRAGQVTGEMVVSVADAWNFGDGESGEGAVETHICSQAGAYQVIVTAANLYRATTATLEVVISDWSKLYLPVLVR